MISKRFLMPLFVMGIILGLSSVAQAQYTCSVTATPAARATATGHTETTGDVTITCTAPSGTAATSQAVLQLDYGVSITNSIAHPPGRPISLVNQTGVLTG